MDDIRFARFVGLLSLPAYIAFWRDPGGDGKLERVQALRSLTHDDRATDSTNLATYDVVRKATADYTLIALALDRIDDLECANKLLNEMLDDSEEALDLAGRARCAMCSSWVERRLLIVNGDDGQCVDCMNRQADQREDWDSDHDEAARVAYASSRGVS